ncbi:MAG: glycosyltransferase family 4 protein [Bacteroidia bacterium]|nr:glycosyltransferase family 4 protein [Bacteroidia bacterium]
MHSGTRITFIHPFIYKFARGIERYTMNLATALVHEGMDVSVLTWQMPEPVRWGEENRHVQIISVPARRYFTSWFAFPSYIKSILRCKYNHILIHFADYGESQAFNILRLLRISVPYSVVLHFPYSQVPHRYHTLRSKGLFKHATNVIAVSAFVAEEARRFTNGTPIVISHGVDTVSFSPDSSAHSRLVAALGLKKDARFLITVSALEERKGVQWVLRALPALLKLWSGLHYVVVGDGPYREALQRLAVEIGVHANVHFLAARTDTTTYYQAAELMLILSRGEASSLVALESLSCGTPVIASRHRPFDELIRPEWGLQVDEENTEEVIHAISFLLNDPERRRSMGEAGREHILAEHTWEHIAKQYMERVFT